MDPKFLASKLALTSEELNGDRLARSYPLQLRKRGLETKIILADAAADTDDNAFILSLNLFSVPSSNHAQTSAADDQLP